jgi:hypothetical protein
MKEKTMEQQWVVTHEIVCIQLPLLALLEALLKWLQKGGKGCGIAIPAKFEAEEATN